MAVKTKSNGLKYNPSTNQVYCAKGCGFFFSTDLAKKGKPPKRCGVCKKKNYWVKNK